jgi:hypothetical protein
MINIKVAGNRGSYAVVGGHPRTSDDCAGSGTIHSGRYHRPCDQSILTRVAAVAVDIVPVRPSVADVSRIG